LASSSLLGCMAPWRCNSHVSTLRFFGPS
jgi:hypothetical protein